MFSVKYVLALILNYALMSNGLDVDLVSPCPKLFVYRHQDNVRRTWYGTIIVTTYKNIFEVNNIRVILDREAESLKIYDQVIDNYLINFVTSKSEKYFYYLVD